MSTKFIYELGTDKSFLEVDGVIKEVACFDVKFQSPDCSGTSRTWYWPKRIAQRKKAQKILNETGVKPHLDTL